MQDEKGEKFSSWAKKKEKKYYNQGGRKASLKKK